MRCGEEGGRPESRNGRWVCAVGRRGGGCPLHKKDKKAEEVVGLADPVCVCGGGAC